MPVQWGTNPAVSQSVFLLRGTHAGKPVAAPANQDYYYWETDTPGGALFQSNGLAWVQLIGGAQSDGAGGTTLPGPINVNSPTADAATEVSLLNGSLSITDTPGSVDNDDGPLQIYQWAPLTKANQGNTALFWRHGAIGTFDYGGATVFIRDDTASTAPLLQLYGKFSGVFARRQTFQKSGGIGQYGAIPPDTQPVGGAATAGATYTAAEQTMLQAVYDALRAFGQLS